MPAGLYLRARGVLDATSYCHPDNKDSGDTTSMIASESLQTALLGVCIVILFLVLWRVHVLSVLVQGAAVNLSAGAGREGKDAPPASSPTSIRSVLTLAALVVIVFILALIEAPTGFLLASMPLGAARERPVLRSGAGAAAAAEPTEGPRSCLGPDPPSFWDLAVTYVSDKAPFRRPEGHLVKEDHSYQWGYDKYIDPLRCKALNVLEIGLGCGACCPCCARVARVGCSPLRRSPFPSFLTARRYAVRRGALCKNVAEVPPQGDDKHI